jgi:hypothetical protein
MTVQMIEPLEGRRMFSTDTVQSDPAPMTAEREPQLTAPPQEPVPGVVIFQRCKPHATVG